VAEVDGAKEDHAEEDPGLATSCVSCTELGAAVGKLHHLMC